VFDPDLRSAFVEIFKDDAADPDPRHFDVGNDVAGAYALDSSAPIEVLPLTEEVS
jgi:hypothetical protein